MAASEATTSTDLRSMWQTKSSSRWSPPLLALSSFSWPRGTGRPRMASALFRKSLPTKHVSIRRLVSRKDAWIMWLSIPGVPPLSIARYSQQNMFLTLGTLLIWKCKDATSRNYKYWYAEFKTDISAIALLRRYTENVYRNIISIPALYKKAKMILKILHIFYKHFKIRLMLFGTYIVSNFIFKTNEIVYFVGRWAWSLAKLTLLSV